MTIPTDLSNLELWYKADAIAGLSDGDAVTTWEDSSGNDRDATVPSSFGSPVYKTNRVNSLPAVYFESGSPNDALTSGYTVSNPFTVFVYYNRKGGATTRRAVSGSNNWLIGPYNSNHTYYNGGWCGTGPTVVTDEFVLATVTNQSPGGGVFRVNTTEYGTNSNTTAPGTFYLGGAAGAYNEPLSGDIAEVIVYSRVLNSTEINSIEAYLGQKYIPEGIFVAQAGIYTEISQESVEIAQAGIYAETSQESIEIAQAGIYVEISLLPLLVSQVGAYVETEQIIVRSSQLGAYVETEQVLARAIQLGAYVETDMLFSTPGEDIEDGDWTDQVGTSNLSPAISEYSINDSTYVHKSSPSVNDYFEVLLADPFGNLSTEELELEWRAYNSGNGIVTMKCELVQGTTVIATDTQALTATPTTYTKTLTEEEYNNITDEEDLRLRFTVTNIDPTIINDNFDDNSLDTSIWAESTYVGSYAAEQNQRWEISSGSSVCGYFKTISSYVLKNTTIVYKVVQHSTNAKIYICPTNVAGEIYGVWNESNWYGYFLSANHLSPQVKDAGASAEVGGDSPDLTAPYWMRIRVDDTTIYFDYADQDGTPSEGDWHNISSEVWDMGTGIEQAQYLYLDVYDSPGTGVWFIDNFSFVSTD